MYGSVAAAKAASKEEHAAGEKAATFPAESAAPIREDRGPCGACGELVYIDQKRQKSKKTGKYFHGAGAGCRAHEVKDQSQAELDKTGTFGVAAKSKNGKRKSEGNTSNAKRSKKGQKKKA